VATPTAGSIVLFLGSDPSLADPLGAHPAALTWMSRFLPANLVAGRAEGATEAAEAEGPFPPDQVMCAQRLIDLARRTHRSVRVVDVNRPGADRALVQRFVAPEDILPIAVRADGQRLVGTEGFGRTALRAFLAAA
jgi:hypothetical protein